ncbi:MAG: amidohydrolase family protein [Phycisphaerales bacterium]
MKHFSFEIPALVMTAGVLLASPAVGQDAVAAASAATNAATVANAATVERASAAAEESVTVFRVGKVLTMNGDDDVINNAMVIVRGTTIEAVGKARDMTVPEGATVIEMKDAWLVPGMVEGHNHTAASSGDLHDYVYLTNPGLRSLDAVDPAAKQSRRDAHAGGVTSALLIPGSGTNMSGFGTMVKFAGETTEETVLKFPASVKIAQAGNPERYWWRVGRSFMNYNTRQTLEQALAYHESWEAFENGEVDVAPPFDPTWDDFRAMYSREFVASVHTQAFQVVMTTVDMLSQKLKIRTVLDHSTFDGFKTAPLVLEQGEENIQTINGPRQFHFDRAERRMWGNAARWWQGGIRQLGINTDSPVVPQVELSYQAAMACWFGWEPYHAIAGLTRVPADALLVGDRVGTIEVGKDADFALWGGDPIDPRSTCWITVINGDVVHDAREGMRRF